MNQGTAAAARERGELSGEIGSDRAWMFRLKRELKSTPLANSLLESLQPLATLGVDMEMLTFVLEDTRSELQMKMETLGISAQYNVDFALSIHSYTLEDPSIYSIINGEMHSPDRDKGAGGVSDRLRACLPYIKYLDTALENLPSQFHFSGRCLRGIKWVFPNEDDHDPEQYFHAGKKVTFYEFKSTSRKMELMYEPRFCGSEGSRTIFDIQASQVHHTHIHESINMA